MSSVRIAILKPSPASPSRCADRHAAAAEAQARQRMRRDHLDAFGDLEARAYRRRPTKAEMPRAPGASPVRANTRVEIGDAAVRDPGLLAIEHIVVAVRRGARRPSRRHPSRRPARTARRRRSIRRAPPRGRYGAFSAGEPARLIAPEPSPCMAKAKSARPSCQASVSRDAGRACASRSRRARRHRRRRRMARAARLAERGAPAAAGRVGVAMIDAHRRRRCASQASSAPASARWRGVEERPVEAVEHRPRLPRHRAPSIALETGLALGGEGLEGAAEILGRHADRLRLRLGFDDLVEAHRPFLMQHRLGHAVGEPRAVGERARAARRPRSAVAPARMQRVEEAPALALLGRSSSGR